MSAAPPRIAVVAGMHRAGTSAIARGLAVLGFDLGPRLMSADVRMNARGFFEDVDIVALDDTLLALAGADWKSVALLHGIDWREERFAGTRDEARALLAARLAPTGRFACKDPRMPRALPFWRDVFASLAVDDAYVIAVRHPAAVVASLTARDGLDPRRSAWLWQVHFVASLALTEGRPRVVVDYDRLLADPARELGRVARAFGLPAPVTGDAALAEFRDHFLSPGLRHSHFASDDFDPAQWPPGVGEAHALAQRLAVAEAVPEAEASVVAALWAALRAAGPLLDYAGSVERAADEVPRLAGELQWAQESLAKARDYAASLEGSLVARDADLAAKEADLKAVRGHADATVKEATTYAESLRAALGRAEAELDAARRSLGAIGATRAGRWLLRRLGGRGDNP